MPEKADLSPGCRHLANPRAFEDFLSGGGALSGRGEVAEEHDYDHRARELHFEEHLRSLVLLHVSEYESGRDLTWAAEEDLLFAATGADFDISASGYGDAMAGRPIEPYWHMLGEVMDAVSAVEPERLRGVDSQTWEQITSLFGEIDIFDATRMELPPSLAEWAETSEEQSALKLQLKLDGITGSRFREALIEKPSGNDNAHFEELLGLEGEEGEEGESDQLFLFDCGYFNLDRYHEITHAGNHFVTKLHSNIKPETVAERPPSSGKGESGGYEVLSDRYVLLNGEDQNWYRVLEVRVSTGDELTILTNLLWVEADKVCLLYRYRWSIEVVFRWLKDLLELDHFISRDPTGIIRQIVSALIVWGLLVLSNQGDKDFSPKQLWREVQAAMHAAIFEFGRRCREANVSPENLPTA